MKKILFLVALTLLGLVWMAERSSAERMNAELARLRRQRVELAGLRHEQDRLSQRLTEAERARNTPREQAAPAMPASAALPEVPLPAPMPLGDWVGVQGAGFRGQATPQASIESTLWAAAGGDVATLRQFLFFSEAARKEAAELLASLPASSRLTYQGPEDLVSALTIKRIPLGEAQLVWLNQSGPDNATACVFLKDPVSAIDANAPEPAPQEAGKAPPQLPADPKTAIAYLALQREGDRWQLVVPPKSIKAMARDLAATSKSGS